MRADKIRLGPREPRLKASEEHWRAVEGAFGLNKPDFDFRNRLARQLSSILITRRPPTFGEMEGPAISCVRRYLVELTKEAQRPSQTLEWLLAAADQGNPHADMAVSMVIHQLGVILEREGLLPLPLCDPSSYVEVVEKVAEEFEITRAALQSTRLSEAAASALDILPKSRGGTPGNMQLKQLLRTLADFVEGMTGHSPGISQGKRYKGPFFRLVTATLDAFAPKPIKSNSPLGKTIQRALAGRRS